MEQKLAFEPHRFEKRQFKPLRDWVIAADMNFDGRTLSSGIVLLKDNGKSDGIRPRWGRVYAVGPDQKDVSEGQWICVAHGRWTRGVDIEDETGKHTIRRIDHNDILLVSDEEPGHDDTISSAVSGK
jgi:co-chaperonin GroES (HSP10)